MGHNRARSERPANDPFEFYATPAAFTHYLLSEVREIGGRIFSPTCGNGDIQAAAEGYMASALWPGDRQMTWMTNDLDSRWIAGTNMDATKPEPWLEAEPIEWTIDNPPFTPALAIAERALACSKTGVALHLRASIHEVLKTGPRRTWMSEHPPTGILWLPRFAYQRSSKSGEWSQDSVCACWLVWMPGRPQFIQYAPEWVLDALARETPAYRARMDAINRARVGDWWTPLIEARRAQR